ncbi:hypothetical protein M404DRAFT_135527, partial [Pisolithus tinctorius Marx 270]
ANQKIQHQQCDGNRENITVMVAICADGSSIAPTIIYKGQGFSTNWHQNNDLNAFIAHSPEGWTDGEIGHLWIQDFDNKTHAKADRCSCLLLIDGDNSHYTKEFLEYARNHNIHILCYPAHGTHAYQGLDIVIFGPLKCAWLQERNTFKTSTQQAVSKENFISIYTATHQKTLTKEMIQAAFWKTGVYPLDPNVITAEMMAPSLETSYDAEGHLPLTLPSPVHAVSPVMCQYHNLQGEEAGNSPEVTAGPSCSQVTPTWHSIAKEATEALASTSAAFLVDRTPMNLSHEVPTYLPPPLTPT